MPILAPPAWATHKGWIGVCPVWLSGLDDEGPVVEPRWRALAWLMPVSEVVFGICFALRQSVDPTYEPEWPIRVTGCLHRPEGT